MSILIRDVEMPTENDELRLIIRSNGQVIISHETYYEEAEAIPVPPHGDLIDRDALVKDLEYDIELIKRCLANDDIIGRIREQQQFQKDCKQNCMLYISESSTVIQAELLKEKT